MAVLVVACPGCQSTLKAPEHMAGRKAKCKKCGTSFRIPGGEPPAGDTSGDGQMLSAMDLPIPSGESNPFDFGGEAPPKAVVEPPAKQPAPLPKPMAKPVPAAQPKPLAKAPPPKPPVEEEVIPAAAAVEDESPASDPLSFDDNDEVPTVAPAAAFSFDASSKHKAKAKSKSKSRLISSDDEELGDEPPKPKRGGYGSASGGGTGKLILAVVLFALVVGAIVGGVLIYLNGKKEPEQVVNEKKDPPAPTPAPDPTPAPKPEAKGTDAPGTKGNDKAPKKNPPGKKTPAGVPGAMLQLPPGRTITFVPLAAKTENAQEPSLRLAIVPTLPGKVDASFALARKVFPPLKAQIDIGVIWQTEPGYQNRGEKLLLGIYSPQTGRQANQVAFEGDGSPEPACDLSVSADLFAHAHTIDGKINVWNTRDGAKVVDGFLPFADNKELKLAAAYLTEPPETFVAVSTTGVVRAFKLPTKEPMGEFVPIKVAAKPLAAGKNITSGPGRQSVVIAVGSTIYQVRVKDGVNGAVAAEVGGDVGRSFGLAASGSQKLLYAFETDSDGKKEKIVMEVRSEGSLFFRWPDKEAGEPTVVGWVGDDLAMVGTDRGSCVWFESDDKVFKPIGLARTPGDKAKHVASDGHWTLLPDPADPKKCVLVEFAKPQNGIVGVLDNSKLIPTVMLTDKSLLK